jgi:hypothetical protein
MATLTINSWTITPLNPDGTDNSFLPAISGSIPANLSTDLIDFVAMGQRLRLDMEFHISGNHASGSPASVNGSTINYAPALFLAYLAPYYPIGTFPRGGYSIVVPSNSAATYQMQLVGQGANENCNQNGDVFLEVVDAHHFNISHEFYMTTDVEGYPSGQTIINATRLSRTSVLNPTEDNISVPSVYGNLRGLNIKVGFQQLTYTVLAQDLSIPIRAAFNGFDSSGNTEPLTPAITFELFSNPGTEIEYLSAFEDCLVKIKFTDPSAQIVENESEIQVTNRNLQVNTGIFTRDLELSQAKLVTTGSSSQIVGPIYGPVTWNQGSGETIITFVLKASELRPNENYQIHVRGGYQSTPSSALTSHGMTSLTPTSGAPSGVNFDFTAEFWTRNGRHAEAFSCAPNERVTSVLSMSVTEYNDNATDPWSTFFNDIRRVTIDIFDEDDNSVFSASVIGTAGSFPESEWIGNELEIYPSETIQRFYLKAFRVPGYNEQNLMNWINQTFRFRWSVQFLTPFNSNFGANYFTDNYLEVRQYENQDVSQQVSNIRFLDPATGSPISNWCDLTDVLVTADIQAVADDVYIAAMVDRFPLGVQLFNDLALEEEDPAVHTLPDYVIFSQKLSDLISNLDPQPIDGSIAFLLDVSELTAEAKWRIYIQAYTVEP